MSINPILNSHSAETSTAYMTRNTLSHPSNFKLQMKRERDESSDDLCTLFIAVVEPRVIMQYKTLIEANHSVVISERNAMHGSTIIELQGTSDGILNALLQVPSFIKAGTRVEDDKVVQFKILFDEKLRGKVIGRKGENISKVRAIPGFSVNVENDMVFEVKNVPLRFNALNVMGVDFVTGIPAALALTSPEEPKSSPKRRKTTSYHKQSRSQVSSDDDMMSYIPSRHEFSTQNTPEYAPVQQPRSSQRTSPIQRTSFVYQPQHSGIGDEPEDQKVPSYSSPDSTEWRRPPVESRARSISPEKVYRPVSANHFQRILFKANQSIFGSEFVSLIINSKEIGSIIGKGGDIVKEINKKHNCFISITNNHGEYRVACIAFKTDPGDSAFVEVLLEIAERLTEERVDKTLMLEFALPCCRISLNNLSTRKVDNVDVDVMSIRGDEEHIRPILHSQILFLKYMMKLICNRCIS